MTARAALGIWTLALACAAVAIALIATGDHTDGKVALIALAVPTELAFVASGIVARLQRPHNRTGVLLMLVGFSWFLGALTTAGNRYVFTAGLAFGTVFTALLAHLFLAFPTGRLATGVDRALAAAFYGIALIGPPLAYVFDEGDLIEAVCDGPCPDNVLSFAPAQTIATAITLAYGVAATVLALLVLARLILRWRRASPALRRALAPVLATAGVLIGLVVVQTLIGFLSTEAAETVNWLVLGAILAVPLSFLYGLLRSRFGATARRLVAELSEKRTPEEVQTVLRRALRDPTLQLGYVGASDSGYVGVDERPLELPDDETDRIVTRIGEAIIVHDASLREQPELDEVVHAARIALERGLSLRSLEASERRARAVLDAIPDNVYRMSIDGTFLDAHATGRGGYPERLIYPGVEPSSLIGQRIDEVMPEFSEVVLEGVRRALANDEVVSVEYQSTEPNGVHDHETRIVRCGEDEVVGIVRDVTERKRQEADLNLFVQELAALNRVAVAVATETAQHLVFDVVTEEVARLLGADGANLVRFTPSREQAVIVGKWSEPGVPIPASGTVDIPGGSALWRVAETGTPARMATDDPGVDPALRERLRALGVTSLVAAPIVVTGDIWGAVVVSVTGNQQFAPNAEERIGQFASLVGVALANAQARAELATLADEQAALSRVAVAVATETASGRVFDVVTEEVARLFGSDAANLVRFTPNPREAVVVGRWRAPGVEIEEVGATIPLDGGPVTEVARTGVPARASIDDPGASASLQRRLAQFQLSSLVAAPVIVSGDRWGAVVVSARGDQELAPNAEERLGAFAKLVAVAVSNAQARDELATLAEEQAALSRVAVAVATEERPERLFHAVSEELGRLFGAGGAAIVRYAEDADEAEIVGGWQRDGPLGFPLGVRMPFQGGAISRVHATGRTARIDLDEELPDMREHMVAAHVNSGVAAPIVVSGRLWGATSISVTGDERFPPDAEERLEKFTSLVAVALSNAQARNELATLAEEQAALSRVAVAVATEERPERLFSAVSEEIGRLFGAGAAATVRYVEKADEVEFVGGWRQDSRFDISLGLRSTIRDGAIERVRRTGRTARIDLEHEPPDVQRHMAARGVSSGVAAPIMVSGQLWGATSISASGPERFPPDAEERLEKFTRLVAVALANAEASEELNASRARIVQAGDAERQRLERNLHDGAQQRLVTLALGLRLARSRLPDEPDVAAELLAQASDELALSLEELRELARGIHPAILTDRGLTPALQALAGRCTLPVDVNGLSPERLPEPIEAAAFYVVSESLANVAKYAEATRARIDLTRDNGVLVVEVSDDGVGGADAGKGSGLRGLSDRVEALGGQLHVASEQGRGTTVRAELPLSTA